MNWKDVKKEKPEEGVEVLVWVEGHRGPSWRNNHALVAYMDRKGRFWEERHESEYPLPVLKWTEITIPEP